MTQREKIEACKSITGRWVIFEHAEHKWFCNGHVIVIADECDCGMSEWAFDVKKRAAESIDAGQRGRSLERGSLFGRFGNGEPIYLRDMGGIIFMERYMRLLPEGARLEYSLDKPTNLVPAGAFVGEHLVGLIMPQAEWVDLPPEIPFIPDDVVFYNKKEGFLF